MLIRKEALKKKFKEDLVSRKFNIHLSYLALPEQGKVRVHPYVNVEYT